MGNNTVEYVKPDEPAPLVTYSVKDFEKELLDIKNEDVRMWTKTALENAPDTFWIEPASKSGKYHPIDETLRGGKITHTKRAFCVMKILVSSEEDRLGDFGDMCLSAILLHDVCSDSRTHADDAYPHYVSKLGQEFVDKYPVTMNMIKSHMGRWGKRRPGTMEECLVHYADNVASKLHMILPPAPQDDSRCNK